MARSFFEVFDSSKITRSQFKLVLHNLGANVESEKELESHFQPIDTDNDGLISFEDFRAFMSSSFKEEQPKTPS